MCLFRMVTCIFMQGPARLDNQLVLCLVFLFIHTYMMITKIITEIIQAMLE